MLEVVLCTPRREVNEYLRYHIDTIIRENELRWISLHSFAPCSIKELDSIVNDKRDYLIILDTAQANMDIPGIQRLTERKNFYICVLSDKVTDAIAFINRGTMLTGFLPDPGQHKYNKAIYENLISILLNAEEEHSALLKALRVTDAEQKMKHLVNYRDIYFIEKKKGTRYSYVYHKNGVGLIDENIQALSSELPRYFFCCNSSTIANLQLVDDVDYSNRILYYPGSLSCTFSATNKARLKNVVGV